ncbi:MAG: hypothetical protein LBF09_04580 [Odoribacteraceae bacterium]|jgi:membrane protein implicated in regulation of membrane protease activity|nr:hypothetical protein [Odoribacteraceae bacterium]
MKHHHHAHAFKLVLLLLLLAAAAGGVMLLWNALLPDITGCSTVNYWQAAGLLVLCRLLFGGLHPGAFHPRGHARLHERWRGMSREEREQFIRRRMHPHRDDDKKPRPPAEP